ncbi:acyl-[acyl-carrier-protein] thioesterase [Lactobacillus xylocopicola]|uniref:Acyl-ACP thioesterase n=1 Tax=Lactobacillus xylocopicola TaxID=2976676 RepID=A0ABN6SPA2_9LACO|nr:acyl-ACP thioesterase domain-containing protein [Lactobacillus xylocopicola]BDR60812.1 acyl-ACP thioesterase [Lactobacillus xylocopicola]
MKYSEQHQINFYECDENKNLKLPAMIDLMMGVSERQLTSSNASTNALNDQGLGWVVTQYHIELTRLPHSNEQVVLSTEPVGYNRFLEYRDFIFTDTEGKELIKAQSEWVLFDLQKRKMVSTDKEMMDALGVPRLKKLPRFPRMRPQAEYQNKRQYRVRYDDLDTNHHMTNGHYFNWFIDTLDRDFLRTHMVKTIDIRFNQEVRYAQMPTAGVSLTEAGEDIKSYHVIEDEERSDKAVCELTWRNL